MARADRFSFVALGDTAYRTPEDHPIYRALIRRINGAKPALERLACAVIVAPYPTKLGAAP